MTSPALPSLSECPLTPIERVTHIGTLNPSDKGNRGDSYEGTGLSFSVHPEEWEQIARLGGAPWWETDLSDRRLLDGHALVEQWKQALEAWGQANGWLTKTVMYRVEWFDDEMDSTVSMLVPTREEAEAELEELEEQGGELIVIDPCWVATAQLDVAMGRKPSRQPQGDAQVLQDVATVWAKEQGLDGVWWDDELDVDRYSAPRGVVFEHLVPSLSFEKVRTPSVRPGLRR